MSDSISKILDSISGSPAEIKVISAQYRECARLVEVASRNSKAALQHAKDHEQNGDRLYRHAEAAERRADAVWMRIYTIIALTATGTFLLTYILLAGGR